MLALRATSASASKKARGDGRTSMTVFCNVMYLTDRTFRHFIMEHHWRPARGNAMAHISEFIVQDDAFDPETVSLLGTAYDSAISKLDGQAASEAVREVVARCIIASASMGERDPDRLREAALAAIGRVT